jgi:MoaA/NifB/PqqE/SkfB family radical SAM enzyme
MIYQGEFRNHKMITWVINQICNFRCNYCLQWHNKKELVPIEIDKLSQSLDYLGNDWVIMVTGGEPFLEKNFTGLCQEISKKHYFAVNTNLSTKNVFEFADAINPQKCLFINAAVHISEREKHDPQIKNYIEKLNYLQKKGFHVIAYYLAIPQLFGRIFEDISNLKSNGIQKVRIKIFRGIMNGKYYPYSYTTDDRAFLLSLDADFPEFEILNSSNSYYGRLCSAGQKFLMMDRAGDLKRCSSLAKNYGNFFNRNINFDKMAKPCPIKICGCPYEGIRNVIREKGAFHEIVKEDLEEKIYKALGIIKRPALLKKLKQKSIVYFSRYST